VYGKIELTRYLTAGKVEPLRRGEIMSDYAPAAAWSFGNAKDAAETRELLRNTGWVQRGNQLTLAVALTAAYELYLRENLTCVNGIPLTEKPWNHQDWMLYCVDYGAFPEFQYERNFSG
jgi:hypothetical protein